MAGLGLRVGLGGRTKVSAINHNRHREVYCALRM